MTLSILLLQYTKQLIGSSSAKFSLTSLTGLFLPFKAILQFIMFAFGSWIGVTRTLDYHHFWWDVLAGSLLGALIAVVMFYWFVKPVMEGSEPQEEGRTFKCGEKGVPLKTSQNYCCCTSAQEDAQIADIEDIKLSERDREHSRYDKQSSLETPNVAPLLDNKPLKPDKDSTLMAEEKLLEDVKVV